MAEEWSGEPRLYLEAGLYGLRQAGNGETREDDPARSALSKSRCLAENSRSNGASATIMF